MLRASKMSISLFLLICMLINMFSVSVAAESSGEVTVNIESFMRGAQEDLQSSELLVAKVEGYDGNIQELTYKWTNTTGTYLYVYNSHNMYNINNTEGEIEIYPDGESGSVNMSGFTYKKTFSGKGYAWAALYGADVSSTDLVGTVTVEVYDPNGNLIAKDSHTGTREQVGSWFWVTYKNHGFVESHLQNDMDQVSFGLFEGDKRNVKDLLGEASIVHITCVECSVTKGEITSGSQYISLSGSVATDYYITGVAKGSGVAEVSIKKGNCKFHKNLTATAKTTVYVYRKPTTTSTATAIELDNLDPDCRYFIGGVEGTYAKDSNGKDIVIFEGLTPNTKYEIEVVGHTEGTLPVYAYVYETTKPAHTGTVEIILNGYYDAATGTAVGTRVDISEVMPGCEKPYVRYEDSELYFPLEKTATGTYTSILSNGTYYIYSAPNADSKICDQQLTISNAHRTRELFFFSVDYDANGGTYTGEATEHHHDTHSVLVSDIAPTKEGYIFTGWKDQNGQVYTPGQILTSSISEPYTLTAQWIEATDVYVNLKIIHTAEDGNGINNDRAKHDITFTIDSRYKGEHNYTEIYHHSIDWDGKSEYENDDFEARFISQNGNEYTVYTAKAPSLTDVPKEKEYTITTNKSGYTVQSVTSEFDENGDLQLYAELIYNPYEVDFAFEVELDEEAKALDASLKPVAVNVKVICWHNTTHDEDYDLPVGDSTVDWFAISKMRETYERIELDANGKGAGTYSVWPTTTDGAAYHYRIKVVSYELADGTILEATDKNMSHKEYTSIGDRYVSKVTVDGGKDPVANDASTLQGAWFNANVQHGTVKALVSINVYDVTLNPNGGTLNGTTSNTVIKDQIVVPNLADYIPVREGGYTFYDWHMESIEGDSIHSGDELTKDVTFVAHWIAPITVKGTVTVSSVYYDEDGEHEILETEKNKYIRLLLQKIDSTGYGITVANINVPITYNGRYGTGTYEFTGLPNNGVTYRVDIITESYDDTYQNELSSSTVVTDYDVYDDNHYTAELNGDNTAVVNAYMHFAPDVFALKYEIDATAIGEGFSPSTVETLVLYYDGTSTNPQNWSVISQMRDDDVYTGQDTTVVNGTGTNSFTIWNYKPDDTSLYDYSIRVNGVDGATYDGANPYYFINYNGTARYDEISGQTKILKAQFVPRRYTITYELNGVEGDEITNMDEYYTPNDTYEEEYYWSYGKLINATPKKTGYKFLGWYDADGNKVEAIEADMHENITLYAKWLPGATFDVLCDAGYYSEARDSEEQVGVISLNAFINNFDTAKNCITSFGIYIYNSAGDVVKATAESTNVDTLTEDSGYFHTVVSNIEKGNFGAKVIGMPFVVLDADGNLETTDDTEIVVGQTMTTSVSDINKWLGAENPYAE